MTDAKDGRDLPDGWVWTTLGDVAAKLSSGGTPSRKRPDYWEGDIPFVKIEDITAAGRKVRETATSITARGLKESPAWLVPPGSLLYTIYGSYGVPALLEIEAATNQAIMAFLPASAEVDLEYIYMYLVSLRGKLDSLTKGTTQKNLSAKIVRSLPVPLAPHAEQRRIVDALEAHFADLDAGVAALEAARRQLERYRRSVLKAAVKGALTSSWRAAHPDTEPASALLDRILEERRERWEAEQLRKYKLKGKTPPSSWRNRYTLPAAPDTDGLAELPEGWVWATSQHVGEVQLGRQRSPKHHSGDHMRPYLRVANVYEDRIDTTDVKEMNFTPEEYERYRLEHGDILLNEGQSYELVGRPAMFKNEVEGACFQNTLVRFRGYPSLNRDFALLYFLACLHIGRFQEIASQTVNISHLGAGRFAELRFPLPPLEEQAAIVEEVDERLSVAEAVAAEIDRQLVRAERLRRSLLQEAFAGRLVPQDPSDESASALLARIRSLPRTEGRRTPTRSGGVELAEGPPGTQTVLDFGG